MGPAEIYSACSELPKEPHVQRIIAQHTTPYDCGRVFALARPRWSTGVGENLMATSWAHACTIRTDRLAVFNPSEIARIFPSADNGTFFHNKKPGAVTRPGLRTTLTDICLLEPRYVC